MDTLNFLYEDCDSGKGQTISLTSEAIKKRFSSILNSNLTKIINLIPLIRHVKNVLIKIKSTPYNKNNNKYGFSIEILEIINNTQIISIGFLNINNDNLFEFDLKEDISDISNYFENTQSKVIRLESYINIDFKNDIKSKMHLDLIERHLFYIEYVTKYYYEISGVKEKGNLFVTYSIDENIKFKIRNSSNNLTSTESLLNQNLKKSTLSQFSQIEFILSQQWFNDEIANKDLVDILKMAKIINY